MLSPPLREPLTFRNEELGRRSVSTTAQVSRSIIRVLMRPLFSPAQTLSNIISSAQASKVSPVSISRRGKCNVKLSTAARNAMDEFLRVIDNIKKLADQVSPARDVVLVLVQSG